MGRFRRELADFVFLVCVFSKHRSVLLRCKRRSRVGRNHTLYPACVILVLGETKPCSPQPLPLAILQYIGSLYASERYDSLRLLTEFGQSLDADGTPYGATFCVGLVHHDDRCGQRMNQGVSLPENLLPLCCGRPSQPPH